MTDSTRDRRPHLILANTASTEAFQTPGTPITGPKLPGRDRVTHGASLLAQLAAIKPVAERAKVEQEQAGMDAGFGLSISFTGFPDVELAFESLARERTGIELLNVRQYQTETVATVFVPDGKLPHFERLIQDYLAEHRDRSGNVRDHHALVNTIQSIRTAAIKELWTDTEDAFPRDESAAIWWEVWLPIRQDREQTVINFRRLATGLDFAVGKGQVDFPERTVVLVKGSVRQFKRSIMTLNSIAELRRAKEAAGFFDAIAPQEQREWLDDLLKRAQYAQPGAEAPVVCVLDTGINRGHPLISPALAVDDLHSVEPGWGTDDVDGHGTEMAGLALFGDLSAALESAGPVLIEHRLESVKLLPQNGGNAGDSLHYGYLTSEAVDRPEISAPFRPRVFSMAVTATDGRDLGRPSAWSAVIDRLAADAHGAGLIPRLICISAGNVRDPNAWLSYPDSSDSDGIHDPGQAWNALTVGAYTQLTDITEPDASAYQPIAQAGGPFSTTSVTWQRSVWPLKPDVVFEGGNAGRDAVSASALPSLSLLTTHRAPTERLFSTTNATSAATAQCACMAAQLMAAYPGLWAETIRALIVHSAEWTAAMRGQFLRANGRANKGEVENLIRRCGYGVPDLERACWSASDSLTLIVQDHLTPFQRDKGKEPKAREMHLHQLPWPLEELEALGETPVEMRVTLSYFIEPNPSERGIRSRYRYESHGLRFDVRRPAESIEEFRARINAAARDEEEGTRNKGGDPDWTLGVQKRHRGSLHSDTWLGTAADLASRGVLAVFPALGWWKTRPGLERYDRAVRYALLVSIRAPGVEVDLYNTVEAKLLVPVGAQP